MNVIFVSPKSWFRNEKHLTWDLGDTKSKALANWFESLTPGPLMFFSFYYFFGFRVCPRCVHRFQHLRSANLPQVGKKQGKKSHGFQQKSVTFPYQIIPSAPQDAQWHRWDDVLRPDGRLANFWKDLRTLRPKLNDIGIYWA